MDNELRVKDNLVIEIYLEEIALGNKDSLMKLYNLTRTSVFGFAFSILQNVSDSEDVTQDVYVNIYKYASMYNRMNKPMAWILRITRNLCLEHIRKDKKHSHSSLEDIDKVISVNDSHYDKLFVKITKNNKMPQFALRHFENLIKWVRCFLLKSKRADLLKRLHNLRKLLFVFRQTRKCFQVKR